MEELVCARGAAHSGAGEDDNARAGTAKRLNFEAVIEAGSHLEIRRRFGLIKGGRRSI